MQAEQLTVFLQKAYGADQAFRGQVDGRKIHLQIPPAHAKHFIQHVRGDALPGIFCLFPVFRESKALKTIGGDRVFGHRIIGIQIPETQRGNGRAHDDRTHIDRHIRMCAEKRREIRNAGQRFLCGHLVIPGSQKASEAPVVQTDDGGITQGKLGFQKLPGHGIGSRTVKVVHGLGRRQHALCTSPADKLVYKLCVAGT